MAYGVSDGHVTDVVTWPWKVKLVTPIRLERNNVENSRKCYLASLELLDSLLWGSTVSYPSDSLASCSVYKNLIHSFIMHYLTFKKLQKALNSDKI